MKYPIPENALEQHTAVIGKTGAGKSYAIRGIVETLLGNNKRVCIVDPKGDWWGLKSSANGKSEGFPVVIFGGEHADIPINSHCGAQVAELIATGNRPCILDFGGWMPGERTKFWIDFAAGIFRFNNAPLWLVIDECHNFAPQGKVLDPDAGKCLHWTNRLGSEGRGRGLRIIMASQRPQKVHKDFLTCAETLIAMRVIHPLDKAPIKDWLDGAGDKEKSSTILSDLPMMVRGEAWAWSPEIRFFDKITFPKIRTYDSFAAPTLEGKLTPKGWASVDLDEVKSGLELVIQEAKANDPKELKRRIAELEKELAGKSVPVQKIEPFKDEDRAAVSKVASDIERARGEMEHLSGHFQALVDESIEIRKRLDSIECSFNKPKIVNVIHSINSESISKSAFQTLNRKSENTGGSGLGKCERAILTALAQYSPRSRTLNQIAILTGYSKNSGSFNNSMSKLRTAGFINRGQDVQITEDGKRALGSWDPLPTGSELQELWCNRLGKCEREILKCLLWCYPNCKPVDEIAIDTGYSRSSGSFNNSMSKLRTLELITKGSPARASEDFFQ